MKRVFIVISLLALLVSCDIIPKECEQLSDMIGDIAALKKNDYNDCELVNQNYMYFAKWMDDSYMEHYPATEYLSQEGDTVMIKGFLSHGYGDTMSYHKGNWICHLHSDSLEAMDIEYNPCDVTIFADNKELFSGIDFTRKCYAVTTLQFGNQHGLRGIGPSPSDFKSCWAKIPNFKIVEIKN